MVIRSQVRRPYVLDTGALQRQTCTRLAAAVSLDFIEVSGSAATLLSRSERRGMRDVK
ncbi:hypothetical protein MesoLj131b_71810 (plasmid) [Mesorhizobium sp. 131-2-5]|nr:hypothetical protein MesoLj131b_71810 [Mesorhizobium sp. 131-2-5]